MGRQRKVIRRPMSAKPRTALSLSTNRKIEREPSDTPALVKRMREDDAFRFGITIIRNLLASVPITFEQDNAALSPVRDDVERVWYQHFTSMMDAVEYGRQAFEKVYQWDGQTYRLDELYPIEYQQCSLEIAPNGMPSTLHVKGSPDITLQPNAYWWLGIDTTSANPYGRSIYQGAPYDVWRKRRDHDKREDVWFRRYSVGQTIARAPSYPPEQLSAKGEAGEVGNSGETANPIEHMRKSITDIEAGGVIVMPSERNTDGAYSYEVAFSNETRDGSALENRRRMLDTMALRSLGIPERSATQGENEGSRAVAEAHGNVLLGVIDGLFGQIAESFQNNIIDNAVRTSGIEGAVMMNWQPLSDITAQRSADLIREVLRAPSVSPLLLHGFVDFEQILKSSGLPIGADPRGALEAIKTAATPPTMPAIFGQAMRDAGAMRRQLMGAR